MLYLDICGMMDGNYNRSPLPIHQSLNFSPLLAGKFRCEAFPECEKDQNIIALDYTAS